MSLQPSPSSPILLCLRLHPPLLLHGSTKIKVPPQALVHSFGLPCSLWTTNLDSLLSLYSASGKDMHAQNHTPDRVVVPDLPADTLGHVSNPWIPRTCTRPRLCRAGGRAVVGPLFRGKRVRLTQTTCGCCGGRLECRLGGEGRKGWCCDDILRNERTEAGVSSCLCSNLNLSGEMQHARQTSWGVNTPHSSPPNHNSSGFPPGGLSTAGKASPDANRSSRAKIQKETKQATLPSFAALI